jgi:VIT1/CCC1 family predicted Fe2+/Mn2+ transporter
MGNKMIKRRKLNHPVEVGLSFGLTSGVITSIGLMVGVYAGTESKEAVLASIVTIALADSMSDALGIHIAEENENVHSTKEIWIATLTTFLAKCLFTGSFLIALLLLELKQAVIVNVIYGLFLLVAYNIFVGKKQSSKTINVVLEHVIIAILVVVASFLLGQWINKSF